MSIPLQIRKCGNQAGATAGFVSFQCHRAPVYYPVRIALDNDAIVVVFFRASAFVADTSHPFPHDHIVIGCAHHLSIVTSGVAQSNDAFHVLFLSSPSSEMGIVNETPT